MRQSPTTANSPHSVGIRADPPPRLSQATVMDPLLIGPDEPQIDNRRHFDVITDDSPDSLYRVTG